MNKTIKRVLAGAAVVALLGAGADYGAYWFHAGRYLEETDDAYLKADYTTIAPKVSGYIQAVTVRDNQKVAAGQVLARIDDRDLKTALAQAKADVDAADAAIRNIDAQLAMQQALVDQAGANIRASEASLAYARQDERRYHELVRSGAATVQRVQQADTALREQSAQLTRSQAGLTAAQKQIDVLRSQRLLAGTKLEHARAVEHQAELDVSYATIVAPIAGTVGARTVRVGQFVQAGTQLMAVVPLKAVYVVANFKETQVTHLQGGEPATISIDGFPGTEVHGHVDSLSPASGLEFALLPPDNATGNFTKIVQRIPVKIALNPDDPLLGRLRPGMSVEATVDTRATVLAAEAGGAQVAER